mmetsp:Transcript_3829/g.6773  ORF Transcript_3829/g.6773 Transcript_3829/m.6773 type:complete len:80 (-) Transcript_3829:1226-1465(-)
MMLPYAFLRWPRQYYNHITNDGYNNAWHKNPFSSCGSSTSIRRMHVGWFVFSLTDCILSCQHTFFGLAHLLQLKSLSDL